MRILTGVVIVAVFAAGLLLGFAGGQGTSAATSQDEPAAVGSEEPSRNGDDRDRRDRRPMYERVGPSEQQLIQIDSILVVHRGRMRDLHEEFRGNYDPRYRALIVQAREAIKTVLTDEQAAEYQVLLDESDRRRAERDARESGRDDSSEGGTSGASDGNDADRDRRGR